MENKKKLAIFSSPCINKDIQTSQPMFLVVLALLPAWLWGVYLFGFKAFLLTVVCVMTCVFSEMIVQVMRKREVFIVKDFSALITGLLLAMVLPPHFSLGLAILGSIFAIIIGKALFGGLGFNVFNPALLARAFLTISFPVEMSKWVAPLSQATSHATPLALWKFEGAFTSLKTLFFGLHGGALGETSVLLLLVGGIFLMMMRIVDFKVPLFILATVLLGSFVSAAATGGGLNFVFFNFFSGGLMLGAFFMATDWVTSPITKLGSIVYAIGIGLVIITIRLFSGMAEGVMFAVLFMNAFVPLINRHTRSNSFGASGNV